LRKMGNQGMTKKKVRRKKPSNFQKNVLRKTQNYLEKTQKTQKYTIECG